MAWLDDYGLEEILLNVSGRKVWGEISRQVSQKDKI